LLAVWATDVKTVTETENGTDLGTEEAIGVVTELIAEIAEIVAGTVIVTETVPVGVVVTAVGIEVVIEVATEAGTGAEGAMRVVAVVDVPSRENVDAEDAITLATVERETRQSLFSLEILATGCTVMTFAESSPDTEKFAMFIFLRITTPRDHGASPSSNFMRLEMPCTFLLLVC
jgi:hypothetical protein